mgnify:CR=1 FL=1
MEEHATKELVNLLEEKKLRELRSRLISMNEADIAIFLEEIGEVQALAVFRILPKEIAAETFSFFAPETQEHIISSMTNAETTEIVESLYIDDVVDMLEELPANVVKKIMINVDKDRRKIINQYLQFKKNVTVGEAINIIRKRGVHSESIYTCYITDSSRKLEGFVSVRTLLVNSDDTKVEDLLEEDVLYVTTTDDQEYVARQFIKYGFLALPVVDHEKRLVGVVTFDDAVDILEEETTEDFEKMAAMAPSEKPYLKTSAVELSKNRIVWLMVLMISATLTGFILDKYEATFAAIPALVTFIPMLTDTGGNAGSQSSTMVIRGLSLGDIESKDIMKVWIKELVVSLMVGFVLSLANFIRIVILRPGEYRLALTVSLSMYATVVLAKTIGGILPIAAKKMNFDPAIMAAPLITTIVDTVSLIVYFYIANGLLGL